MAQSNLLHIYCTGPNESCIRLQAVFMSDLDVNILTPRGHQGLLDFSIREGGEFSLQAATDDVLTVGDCVHLPIWTDESTRTESVTLYLPTDESTLPHIPSDVHVILGKNCTLAVEELGGRQPAIAPVRLCPENQQQVEERERTRPWRREQARKVEEARLELEAQRRKAEEENRRQGRRS